MQPGMVAEAGVRAAWLAQAGITGAVDAIEGRYGYFPLYEHGDYDADLLTRGLGESFEVEKTSLKRYPICGMSHPAVDALRDIMRDHSLTSKDIVSVTAEGSRFVIDQVGRRYEPGENPEVTAQFNLAYGLATVLETGTFRLADLEPQQTLSPERRAAADRIVVTLDEALQGKWTCRIRVKLHDGREIAKVRSLAASQEERPLSDRELEEKFLEAAALSKAPFADGAPERLASLLYQLPRLPSLGPSL